ncbi:hypothetical protein JCM13664_04340 [Methylothermus subterraneus]
MNLRTSLSKARGLGSARSGSGAWWAQRVTAVALVPLSLWLAWFLARLPELSQAEVARSLAKPESAVWLLAYFAAAIYHAMLGLKVVIEDYVSTYWLRTVSLVAMQLALALLAVIAVVAVVRLVIAG